MTNRSEVKKVFVRFYNMIETQFQTKICILHSGNGTKYFNLQLTSSLYEKSILHQAISRDTPQQNEIVEWKNRNLFEVAHGLMLSTNVPEYLWVTPSLHLHTWSIKCQLRFWILELL